jgi:glyoxylase-like metal-dependent hydrolase (beta-lactamase superfamily II)
MITVNHLVTSGTFSLDGGTWDGLTVLHTPGHSRGAVCFHLPDQGLLFSGDTLFAGGPGATGRSFSAPARSSTRSAAEWIARGY